MVGGRRGWGGEAGRCLLACHDSPPRALSLNRPAALPSRYGPPLLWTRNNAAGIWHSRVVLPHSLVGSPAAAAAVAGPAGSALVAASTGDDAAAAAPAPDAKGGSASKRPPLHPGSAPGAATPGGGAPSAAAGGVGGSPRGVPRQRSVPDIPQHEEVEKQQPGVTAQADDARLLSSPLAQPAAAGSVAAAAAAAAVQADDGSQWRTLLEEQLRCGKGLLEGRRGVGARCLLLPLAPLAPPHLSDPPAHLHHPTTPHPPMPAVHRCGLCLVDVEYPLVALADGVYSRAFSGGPGVL